MIGEASWFLSSELSVKRLCEMQLRRSRRSCYGRRLWNNLKMLTLLLLSKLDSDCKSRILNISFSCITFIKHPKCTSRSTRGTVLVGVEADTILVIKCALYFELINPTVIPTRYINTSIHGLIQVSPFDHLFYDALHLPKPLLLQHIIQPSAQLLCGDDFCRLSH